MSSPALVRSCAFLLTMFAAIPSRSQAPRGAAETQVASVAPKPSSSAKGSDGQTPKVIVDGKNDKKVFRLVGGLLIEGRVAKPEAFYLLPRSSFGTYEILRPHAGFVERIPEALSDEPFHRSEEVKAPVGKRRP